MPCGNGSISWALRDWVDAIDLLRAEQDEPFPERLARAHNSFERIHPFLDGNWRTGRLLLNLILARLGYPPAIIFKSERLKYLNAMRKADAGDCGPQGEHIARAVTNHLYRFVVPAIAGSSRLVPLASLANGEGGPSAAALRVAAQRGRLRGQKQPDGTWMSSRQWVEHYIERRYQR